jgi:hypothetical protein
MFMCIEIMQKGSEHTKKKNLAWDNKVPNSNISMDLQLSFFKVVYIIIYWIWICSKYVKIIKLYRPLVIFLRLKCKLERKAFKSNRTESKRMLSAWKASLHFLYHVWTKTYIISTLGDCISIYKNVITLVTTTSLEHKSKNNWKRAVFGRDMLICKGREATIISDIYNFVVHRKWLLMLIITC